MMIQLFLDTKPTQGHENWVSEQGVCCGSKSEVYVVVQNLIQAKKRIFQKVKIIVVQDHDHVREVRVKASLFS